MSLKSLLSTLLVALICAANLSPAQAQDMNARVLVPDVPGGAVVSGCYKADRGLYGPYTLTFCLQRKGIYAVRGDGLACDGRLTYGTRGRDVDITLNRSRCNGNRAWAKASITCRPRSLLDVILSDLFNDGKSSNGRVLVPDAPQVRALRCVYSPTVAGNRQATFVAKRVNN